MGPVLFTQYCLGDNIEKSGMGGACSLYGESRAVYSVLVRKPDGDTGVDGRIILR